MRRIVILLLNAVCLLQLFSTFAEFTVGSEHCFPTLAYGELCTTLGEPYISSCSYDGAGRSLTALYGPLIKKTTAVSANIMQFDQTIVRFPASPAFTHVHVRIVLLLLFQLDRFVCVRVFR